jgi:AcrR family transcriptional regulator
MSPRGVAIPGVREQLFAAAIRVLSRDGPDGLTSRAIAREAGVARGLLFNHFADLDHFLAELILDRVRSAAAEAARLPSLAGTGTVAGNLTDAALSLLRSDAFAMARIVLSRPSLISRIGAVAGIHHGTERHRHKGAPSPLDAVETAVAGYLDAEKAHGRVSADTDTETVAFALIGALHHLVLTNLAAGPDLDQRVRRIVSVLVAGPTPK